MILSLEKTVDEKYSIKEVQVCSGKQAEEEALRLDVRNIDRTLGTIFGSEITKKYAR